MCSNDCDSFCLGDPDCHCHECPESGATETWSCTVDAEMACYDQVNTAAVLHWTALVS